MSARHHLALAAALVLAPAAADAAVFAQRNPATQDRFLSGTTTPNPTFILNGLPNLSGVAVDQSGPGATPPRGATLIAPNYYLTAAHFTTQNPEFLGSDGVVRSYATAETFTLTTTFTDAEGVTRTRDSDVRIGRLATSPTADGVATLPIAVGTFDDLANRSVFAVGQDNVAGTNVVQRNLTGLASDPDPGSTFTPTFVAGFDFDTPSNGGVGGTRGDEIGLTPGDSSNAQLITLNGELALIGAHFGIDAPQDSSGNFDFSANYASFSSFASRYVSQIEGVVGGTGQSIRTVAVPEPASLSLLAATGLSLLRRRRVAGA